MRTHHQPPIVSDRRLFLKACLAAAPLAIGSTHAAESASAAVLRRLKGPMASVAMPYKDDFSVDHDSLRKWVAFMCERKVPVLFMTLGDSELDVLDDREIADVIRTVAKEAAGRTLVIGGTGPWWTGRSLELLKRIADSGVDAVNVHLSARTRADDDVVRAFEEIAAKTALPVLGYENGASVAQIERLAKIPGVIGVKCHAELYGYYDFLRATPRDRFAILSAGQMKHFLFGYLFGSPAYLCPLAPFAPEVSLRFYEALTRNDLDKARAVINEFEEPLLKVTIPLGYPNAYKSALHLTGHYRTNLMRPPQRGNNAAQLAQLRGFLQTKGLLRT